MPQHFGFASLKIRKFRHENYYAVDLITPAPSMLLIFSSFIAGLFTFFAPCTLPLLPGFLAIVSGGAGSRARIIRSALAYLVGFSIVFIAIGSAFSLAADLLQIREAIQEVAGIILIILGLSLLGVLPLSRFFPSLRMLPARPGGAPSAFVFGVVFALGWSPCVGPLLGSVFLLASSTPTMAQGLLLLTSFCIGLAIPFLIVALLVARAVHFIDRYSQGIVWLNRVAGIFLAGLGVLLLFDQFYPLIGQLIVWTTKIPWYESFINRFF